MSNTKDGVRTEEGGEGAGGPPGSRPSGDRPSGSRPPGRPMPPRNGPTLDRDAVLRATSQVLDTHGYEKTTIRTISKHLGCAVGSIYRHFTDKNQLLDEVVQGRFVPIAEAAEAGHPPEATTRAFLAAAAARPEQYRLMFWLSALGRGRDEAAAVPEVMRRLFGAWARPEQLGSESEAKAHWGRLQGELLLGHHGALGPQAESALAAIEGVPAGTR